MGTSSTTRPPGRAGAAVSRTEAPEPLRMRRCLGSRPADARASSASARACAGSRSHARPRGPSDARRSRRDERAGASSATTTIAAHPGCGRWTIWSWWERRASMRSAEAPETKTERRERGQDW